ncbi:hypothetical protein LKL35_36230 [Streptomyces sp. ET3-23]|uniref:hypothetical protein n=1 Tax=Streptomyces sp. ET3-23 TaxID=2885643 RepID=UPI001D11CAD4|nr:hypothetical protein [Streptomyces sp. ET3-23]MCC2280783.1 hypothetical protein [Streptomyces sp. ET3-23]
MPWGASAEELASAARRWLGPEHGRTVIPCTPGQRAQSLELIGGMGLLEAALPQAGTIFEETSIIAGL